MHAYVAWSRQWIAEAARLLKPTGTMYICGFLEILADVKVAVAPLFAGCRWLVWHYKNKANLGRDWGRSHESILHLRKGISCILSTSDNIQDSLRGAHAQVPGDPQAETSQYGKGTKQERDDSTPHPQGAKAKDVLEIPTTCNGMGGRRRIRLRSRRNFSASSFSPPRILATW